MSARLLSTTTADFGPEVVINRDALRDTEMSGEMVRALGGRSGGGSASDNYGSGFTPERLYGAIQAVRYDGLDLSHLALP